MAEQNLDVTVILVRDGKIVNGTSGVMMGMSSKLGVGKIGYMQLGEN